MPSLAASLFRHLCARHSLTSSIPAQPHCTPCLTLMPFLGLKLKSQTWLEGKKGFYLGIYFKDP